MNTFLLDTLCDPFMREKALLKYVSRRLEAELVAQYSKTPSRRDMEHMLINCRRLAHLYLKCIDHPPHKDATHIPLLSEAQIFSEIEAAKLTLSRFVSYEKQMNDYFKLYLLYSQLATHIRRQQSPLPEFMKQAMLLMTQASRAEQPEQWLLLLLKCAQTLAGSACPICAVMKECPQETLSRLCAQFEKPEWLNLLQAFYVCKMDPQKMSEEPLHPEKLISVKRRVSEIYTFIEQLQHRLWSNKTQGEANLQDYLFHGDDLPPGISVELSDTQRTAITRILKEIPDQLGRIFIQTDLSYQLNEIFKAYKFWFNPSRLLDIVMALPGCDDIHSNESDMLAYWVDHLQPFYHSFSTSDCIDLYGYFTNKDSVYLLKTLRAAAHGEPIAPVLMFQPQEQQVMLRAYARLYGLITALCHELHSRSFCAEYIHIESSEKPLHPRRRSVHALYRLLSLYGNAPVKENPRINALFEALEYGDIVN